MKKVIIVNTKTRTIRVENADKNIDWITVKGTHVPIEKGQSKSSAVQKFVEKKRPTDKKQADTEKVLRAMGVTDPKTVAKKARAEIAKKQDGMSGKDVSYKEWKDRNKLSKEEKKAAWAREEKKYKDNQKEITKKSGPSKDADVSDIITNYKEKMKAAGPRASLKKTDRIEADAIKEFMTRKLGANRPYDDYYQYWLNGMDEATKDAFNEIYNESEAREMAFSELASDVDHSGMARGEPTYDELMKWAQEQKAKKAAKKSIPSTQNESWGFYGTIANEFYDDKKRKYDDSKTKEAWEVAFEEVRNATGWNDDDVLEFLDSRDGRHFADQAADFGAGENMKDGISQAAKFWKERKWFPQKNTDAEYADEYDDPDLKYFSSYEQAKHDYKYWDRQLKKNLNDPEIKAKRAEAADKYLEAIDKKQLGEID